MALVGFAATLEARSFGMGTMARTGPGSFPATLGAALTLVGIVITVAGGRDDGHDAAVFGCPARPVASD